MRENSREREKESPKYKKKKRKKKEHPRSTLHVKHNLNFQSDLSNSPIRPTRLRKESPSCIPKHIMRGALNQELDVVAQFLRNLGATNFYTVDHPHVLYFLKFITAPSNLTIRSTKIRKPYPSSSHESHEHQPGPEVSKCQPALPGLIRDVASPYGSILTFSLFIVIPFTGGICSEDCLFT